MELRYSLSNGRYEREAPNKNLRINEVLFLKYFESEVDQRMKKYDALLAAFKHPLSVVEGALRLLSVVFYLTFAVALLQLFLSVSRDSPYSPATLAKGTKLATPLGYLESVLAPKQQLKYLNCSTSATEVNCAAVDEAAARNGRLLAQADIIEAKSPVEALRLTPAETVLEVNGTQFKLKEQSLFSRFSLLQRLVLGLSCLSFLSLLVLSHSLSYLKGKADSKLTWNIDVLMLEENQSQSMFQFFMNGGYGDIRVRINASNYPAVERTEEPRISCFEAKGAKENIECVNRNGYKMVPAEEE